MKPIAVLVAVKSVYASEVTQVVVFLNVPTGILNYTLRVSLSYREAFLFYLTPIVCSRCRSHRHSRISLHVFTKDVELRKVWKCKLQIGKSIPRFARVCSSHFLPTDFISTSLDVQFLFLR
mgnify:CR=1 FL=1